MDIRPLATDEAAALSAFKDREWPAADLAHFGTLEMDFEKHPFTLVAREGDAIAGYVKATLDMGALYIDGILVAAGYQGRGIGKRLMDAAEQEGRRRGAHKVWLQTGADWDARFLYERLGYERTGILKEQYARKDFLIYEKFL